MSPFQEVLSCKLIFFNNLFSNTRKKNSTSTAGTDSGPHLQACREKGPTVYNHFGFLFIRSVDKVDHDFSSVFLLEEANKAERL